jgi:hypothetical protein
MLDKMNRPTGATIEYIEMLSKSRDTASKKGLKYIIHIRGHKPGAGFPLGTRSIKWISARRIIFRPLLLFS